ncbi:sensor histidine kinase, partial [Arthrobacter sp. JCM 19049]|uniref:sensor histidine kinase n=1 Tax=Arthrobacter sp. JCM 19049 TaxID=1460643 RepID=UPI000B2C8E12
MLRQRRSTERQIQDLRAKITSEGDQARRLSRMVGDLRGLAELEVAQLERVQWTWNSCCVTCWMTRTKDPRAGTPNNAGSPCTCQGSMAAAGNSGDPDLLRLSLHNLLSNAIKYSSAGDSIEITAQELDGSLIIDIADTGRGIPEEEQDLVLEELARASNARDMPGSGIGLALVR